MNDSALYFRFEFEEAADGEALAKAVQDQLARFDGVSQADADVDQMRLTGAEVVAAIAVAVIVVRGTRELAQEINELLTEIGRIVRGIKGLKSAFVEIDGQPVPLAEVDDDDVARLTGT
jgi:hypothetical protein